MSNYATSSRQIAQKYLATENVVTKWAYKQILQSRANAGDKRARLYLASLEHGGITLLRGKLRP